MHNRSGGRVSQAHAATLNLAEARISSGVSLEQISEITKISVRWLEVIESEEFGKLPGGVFAISWLRQYARCTCFDENLLVERARQIIDLDTVVTPEALALSLPVRQRRGLFRLSIPAIPTVRIRATNRVLLAALRLISAERPVSRVVEMRPAPQRQAYQPASIQWKRAASQAEPASTTVDNIAAVG